MEPRSAEDFNFTRDFISRVSYILGNRRQQSNRFRRRGLGIRQRDSDQIRRKRPDWQFDFGCNLRIGPLNSTAGYYGIADSPHFTMVRQRNDDAAPIKVIRILVVLS